MRAVTFQSMVAHVVAGQVLAHLVELHAAALEDAVVLAGEQRRSTSRRVRIWMRCGLVRERLGGSMRGSGRAQGTGTLSKIRWITVVGVRRSSASAS